MFTLARMKYIDTILDRGDLADYHLAHSARADLCSRLGKKRKPKPPRSELSVLRGWSQNEGFSRDGG